MNTRHSDSIYDMFGESSELSLAQMGCILVDYTDPRYNSLAGIAGSINQGVTYEAHGTWLYVDQSSIAAPQATLYADSDDSRTIALVPGKSVTANFDRIRVFSTAGQIGGPSGANVSQPQNPGHIQTPSSRIFYGSGKNPFTDGTNQIGSVSPLAYNFVQSAPSTSLLISFPLLIPQGAVINATIGGVQVTGAAETSFLRPFLRWNFIDGTVMDQSPVSLWTIDVNPAAASTARCQGRFENVRAPRDAISVALRISNFGNAATNNIQIGAQAVFLG